MKKDQDRIDDIRKSALTISVGTKGDGKQIEMIAVEGGKLYAVSERAVHTIFLADDIDPQRMNASIPNGSQKILNSGASSEIVSRVFLTSAMLFKSHHFSKSDQQKHLIELALNVTQELLAAEKIKLEVRKAISQGIKNIGKPENRDFSIPSVVGLNESMKSFLQRLEHTFQLVFELTSVFYPRRKKMYDGFVEAVGEEFESTHDFVQFSKKLADLARFIRNTRSCIEHPKSDQRFIVKDFALDVEGYLKPPTIEIDHQTTPQPEMLAGRFLKHALDGVVDNIEVLLAHLANAHINERGKPRYVVSFMHPAQRRADDKIRLSYFVKINDTWQKLS